MTRLLMTGNDWIDMVKSLPFPWSMMMKNDGRHDKDADKKRDSALADGYLTFAMTDAERRKYTVIVPLTP